MRKHHPNNLSSETVVIYVRAARLVDRAAGPAKMRHLPTEVSVGIKFGVLV
jgi:hypothetical protein